MGRRWAAVGWLCAGLLLVAGAACTRKAVVSAPSVEPPKPGVTAPGATTLAEQLEELRERVDAVRETRDRLRAEVRESPGLLPLREAMAAAEAAYKDKQKADPTYVAAVKAEEDARAALQRLVQQKLEADEEARRLTQAKPESSEAEREVREKLHEIRQRIESDDPDVRAARERLEAASEARREAYDNEALSTLRAARDAARAAFEAKVKELEAANAALAAALEEREELRARVAELEKKVGEQSALGKEPGARKRGFTAGPYLTGLGADRVTVAWETGEPVPGQVEYYIRPNRHQTLSSKVASRFHRVSITGLPPGTECWYRVHAGSEVTPFARFRTAPDGPAPFRFAVYGDSRSNPRYHARIAQAILKHQPAFVVHTGDLVGNGLDARQWEPEFFRPARDLLRQCPLLPTMGTHDGNSPIFHRYFGLQPEPTEGVRQADPKAPEEPAPAWFAWTFGSLDVFVLNSYARYEADSPQFRWLSGALASSRAPWRAAVFHKTLFSSGRHGGTESLRRHVLPLLLKHGVDIVFVGHEHIYERTCAIAGGPEAEGNALVQIVTGGGGASLHKVKPGVWTAYGSSRRNYCIVDVEGDTLVVTAYGEAGEAFDKVVLEKHAGRREFGQTVPATALEFLQSVKRFAAFSFPHVQSGVRKREFTFTVPNFYADELRGELSWEISDNAWSVSPPSQSIRVAPGRSERVTFTAELAPLPDGSTVGPVPRAVLAAGGRTVTTPGFAIERPPRLKAPVANPLPVPTCVPAACPR